MPPCARQSPHQAAPQALHDVHSRASHAPRARLDRLDAPRALRMLAGLVPKAHRVREVQGRPHKASVPSTRRPQPSMHDLLEHTRRGRIRDAQNARENRGSAGGRYSTRSIAPLPSVNPRVTRPQWASSHSHAVSARAFHLLQREGLVGIDAHRGATVVAPTSADLREYYGIRPTRSARRRQGRRAFSRRGRCQPRGDARQHEPRAVRHAQPALRHDALRASNPPRVVQLIADLRDATSAYLHIYANSGFPPTARRRAPRDPGRVQGARSQARCARRRTTPRPQRRARHQPAPTRSTAGDRRELIAGRGEGLRRSRWHRRSVRALRRSLVLRRRGSQPRARIVTSRNARPARSGAGRIGAWLWRRLGVVKGRA
jgi:hypothetical protein